MAEVAPAASSALSERVQPPQIVGVTAPIGWGALALLALVLTRLASAGLLYQQGFGALSADGYLRVLLAADWAARPYFALSGVWLPGHLYALGTVLMLWPDLLVAPRVFSLALGCLALLLVAWQGSALARDWRGGVLAALLLATDPASLWLNATPLAENLALVLLLAALTATTQGLRSGRTGWFVLAGGMLALANAVRFEGWLVSALWGGILMLQLRQQRPRPWRLGATLLALLGIAPVAFLVGNGVTLGDPFFWPNAFRAYNLRAYGPGPDPAGAWEALWLAGGPLILAHAAASFWAARQPNRAVRVALLLTAPPLLIALVALALGREPLVNGLRYLVPFLVLLVPLTGAAGLALLGWVAHSGRGLMLAVLALSASVLAWRLLTISPPVEPSTRGLAVGQQIAALRASGALPAGAVVIAAESLAAYAMMVGANDSERLLLDRPLDPRWRVPPISTLDPATASACLAQYHAVALVRPLSGVPNEGEQLAVVNGYQVLRLPPRPGLCPGIAIRWGEVARETTGRLFAALAYAQEGEDR
ncbi:MAG: hypothetical protein KatS3mg061_3427 [Dehalococcoidia bacterium]|nr:MAG: hypothetical protein KatS3mg061_3427 [Dehalococcoidia bacterium]